MPENKFLISQISTFFNIFFFTQISSHFKAILKLPITKITPGYKDNQALSLRISRISL
jgi:hypothetical protein